MPALEWGTLGRLHYQLMHHQIHETKQLTESIEKLLEREVGRFNDWIDERAEGLDEERRAELCGFYSDEHYRYAEALPATIRSSLLVSSYSALEVSLLRLCDWLQSERGLLVAARDLRGKGIRQAKEYFVKVLQLPLAERSDFRHEILFVNQLRNAIVHEDGMPNPKNTGLIGYIRTRSSVLSLDSTGTILLSRSFMPHFLHLIRQLFQALEDGTVDDAA